MKPRAGRGALVVLFVVIPFLLWLDVPLLGAVSTAAVLSGLLLLLPALLDALERRPRLARLCSHGVLLLFSLIALFPVLRVISISLRPGDKLLSTELALIPANATLDAYTRLFTDEPFLIWLRNSALLSITATLIGLVFASTAGYAFSRFRFPGRKIGLSSVLTTQMFPATMLLLPLFVLLARLHLVNTFIGLGVIYISTALPFSIWLMKGYYDTIPASLEEAAMIDGASRWYAFWRIIVPLAAPALVITALFSFMNAWTDYIVAAQILQDERMFTLPVGLKSFQSNMTTEWGLYAAAALLVSIPVVALFLFLNRWLVSGLTLGGVKD
jgi:arabinogalactan oligomer/maltooligosaccharide transport system permease protein